VGRSSKHTIAASVLIEIRTLPAPSPITTTTLEEEEELKMTFQVALVGTDGLIVASDRKVGYKTREGSSALWDIQTGQDNKFACSGSVVCFFAGGPQAKTVSTEVLRSCPPDQNQSDWEASLQRAADSVLAGSTGDEVLVVRLRVGDIFLINRVGKEASVSPVSTWRCTGVIAKCRFLAQNFWRMAPVTELRALALMLLHHAASERSEAVGEGFDFMTIHNGQVEWEHFAAKDPEIESLRLAFSNAVESVLFPSTRK
jgi:hypothetical protein